MKPTDLFKPNPAMVTRIIDGEAVIMDPLKGKVLALNAAGSLIWKMIDGQHTKEEILNAVCREFNVGIEAAAADLDEFIVELRTKDLLSESSCSK